MYAVNTTYTADNHLNSTNSGQGNTMNVNGYKNTEDTHRNKQTLIKGKLPGRERLIDQL